VKHHYYSAPHSLVHEEVEARVTGATVEIYHRNRRIASHVRSDVRGKHTTEPSHMRQVHLKHLEWTPSRIIHWAGTIGPNTRALVEAIRADRPHPEQGYRSCLGILRLGNGPATRLEAACGRAVVVGARSYRRVDSILTNGLDRISTAAEPEPVVGYHGGDLSVTSEIQPPGGKQEFAKTGFCVRLLGPLTKAGVGDGRGSHLLVRLIAARRDVLADARGPALRGPL